MTETEKTELLFGLVGRECRVYSDENRFLFVGKIVDFDSCSRQIKLEDYKNNDVPWRTIASEMHIKLHMNLTSETNRFIFMYCIVHLSVNEYLLAGLEEIMVKEETRDNFRQTIMKECMIYSHSSPEKKKPCTVVDVSAKGIGIHSQEEYDREDLLIIRDSRFRKDGPLHNLTFRIVRKKSEEQGFFYGCQFMDMTPREEHNLMNDIFAFQMQELRADRTR